MDFGDTPHIIGMGTSEYSGHKKLSPKLAGAFSRADLHGR